MPTVDNDQETIGAPDNINQPTQLPPLLHRWMINFAFIIIGMGTSLTWNSISFAISFYLTTFEQLSIGDYSWTLFILCYNAPGLPMQLLQYFRNTPKEDQETENNENDVEKTLDEEIDERKNFQLCCSVYFALLSIILVLFPLIYLLPFDLRIILVISLLFVLSIGILQGLLYGNIYQLASLFPVDCYAAIPSCMAGVGSSTFVLLFIMMSEDFNGEEETVRQLIVYFVPLALIPLFSIVAITYVVRTPIYYLAYDDDNEGVLEKEGSSFELEQELSVNGEDEENCTGIVIPISTNNENDDDSDEDDDGDDDDDDSDEDFKTLKNSTESGYKSLKNSAKSGFRSLKNSIESGYKSLKSSKESGYKRLKNTNESGYKSLKSSKESGYRSLKNSIEQNNQTVCTFGKCAIVLDTEIDENNQDEQTCACEISDDGTVTKHPECCNDNNEKIENDDNSNSNSNSNENENSSALCFQHKDLFYSTKASCFTVFVVGLGLVLFKASIPYIVEDSNNMATVLMYLENICYFVGNEAAALKRVVTSTNVLFICTILQIGLCLPIYLHSFYDSFDQLNLILYFFIAIYTFLGTYLTSCGYVIAASSQKPKLKTKAISMLNIFMYIGYICGISISILISLPSNS